jgi:hypothetical protein
MGCSIYEFPRILPFYLAYHLATCVFPPTRLVEWINTRIVSLYTRAPAVSDERARVVLICYWAGDSTTGQKAEAAKIVQKGPLVYCGRRDCGVVRHNDSAVLLWRTQDIARIGHLFELGLGSLQGFVVFDASYKVVNLPVGPSSFNQSLALCQWAITSP